MDEPEDKRPEEPRRPARKDRLIQTRVPRDLEATLKQEARRQRRTVSHLIRGVLEDTFQLVDGVVADVDQLVSDGVELAKEVRRTARRLTDGDRAPSLHEERHEEQHEERHDELHTEEASPGKEPSAGMEPSTGDDLSHIYAWNEVVLHRAAHCSQCGSEIPRGQRGFAGLSDQPGAPRAWLCAACIQSL